MQAARSRYLNSASTESRKTGKVRVRDDAGTSTRDACATQCDWPHRPAQNFDSNGAAECILGEPKLQIYLVYEQVDWFEPNALVVRTNVDPLSLAATVRRTVWEIDKDQPVSDIRSMDQIVCEAVARQRFSMLLLGVFASLALVLAAVGIYGVMSYSVAQRTREIGIRMALGAQRSDVLKMTVRQGLQLVFMGLVIGLGAAFALTRVMVGLLFGVSATDPKTFLTISLVLVSVALLASYIPALRAMKVDPMVALRYQ